MGIRVAVAGASGYAGGELLRLLAGHPDLEIAAVSAGSSAGKPVTSIHPNLTGHPAFDGKNFEPTTAETLGDAELIFMALPHGESATLAAQLPGARIVDLSADFRLGDEAAWHQFYGDAAYAGRWAYGLPELPGAPGSQRGRRSRPARTVAAPGCYATTSILALAPLLAAGLVEPADIVIVAASGTSGAGRSPRADLLASEVMGSMSAYKVGGTHRHTPEIEQALSEVLPGAGAVTLSFTPTLAPMPRGILATSTARLTAAAAAAVTRPDGALRAAFADAYGDSPFVHLLPEGQWPATAAVYGSNGAHVQVAADPHAGRAVVISTTDNLGKGAAGQAVQIANLCSACRRRRA